MAYYSELELDQIGFKKLGRNIKISSNASIYDAHKISIDDNSRIDDFCVISGNLSIGQNVHITSQCLIAGGDKGIIFEDFTTLAYGVKVFSQTDDYSGHTMTNSTIPEMYKNEFKKQVIIKKYTIIGAGSIIMPGIIIETGTSIGANSLVLADTLAWSIYVGSPAKKIKDRAKDLLDLCKKYKGV